MRRAGIGLLSLLWLFLPSVAVGQNYPPYKPGFPVTLPGAGTIRGHPVVADLGLTPGHKSIIFGTVTGRLYVILWDGTIAPGFPVQLSPVSLIDSSPAVGILDNVDGKPAIVFGYGSILGVNGATSSQPGGVAAYRRDGTLLWNRPALDFSPGTGDGIPDAVVGTPAIGDIDGDGKNEVVWGGLDARVYAVNGLDGTDKSGWPIFVRDTVFSSPALFDMNGDGKLEVIIGVDSHLEPAVGTLAGGYLHVFFPTGQPTSSPWGDPPGTLTLPAPEMPGFPQYIPSAHSSPSIGDIDGDGSPEIVFGTGPSTSTGTRYVYAVKCDGTPSPGWPVTVDGWVSSSPALADVNGDGILDVIITDDGTFPSTSPYVYAFNGVNGALIWKVIPKSLSGATPNAGEPVVADVMGDSKLEVLVPVNSEVCVLDAATGLQLTESYFPGGTKTSFYTPTALSSAVVTDFESDGIAIEVVAVSGTPFPSATDTYIAVFNPVKSAPAAEGPWGFFRQNQFRKGVAPTTPSCPPPPPPTPLSYYSLSPCRILDTRWPAGPYGGPALSAQGRRSFAVLGQCAIPADAKALTVNLTAVDPTSPGNLQLFGGQGSAPNALVLIYKPGLTRAGQAMVQVIGGEITIESTQTTGSINVLLDVSGVFR